MSYKVEDGSYCITEQGDLGLGLTPINEASSEDEKKKKKNEDDNNNNLY